MESNNNMELNDKYISDMLDPQDGMNWEDPLCLKCTYNKNGFCEFFNCKRKDVKIDTYNCEKFEDSEKKALEMFGV